MMEQHKLPSLDTHIFSYRGHDIGEDIGGFVYEPAWSPDGERVASCGSQDTRQIVPASSRLAQIIPSMSGGLSKQL